MLRYLAPSKEWGPKPWGSSSSRAAAFTIESRVMFRLLASALASSRLQQGGALGTDGGAEGGILHVAAGKHGAVPAQQGGSHRKMRIGYIGKSMHGKRAGYQLPVGHIRSLLILCPFPSPGTCFLYYNACGSKPQAQNARASLAAWLWRGKRFRPYCPLPRKARGPDQAPI